MLTCGSPRRNILSALTEGIANALAEADLLPRIDSALRTFSGSSRCARYRQDLAISVRDNGIGMDPAVTDLGKAGHFGLQGMKELAART